MLRYFLARRISDYWIAVPMLVLWIIVVPYLFMTDMRMHTRSFIESLFVLIDIAPLLFSAMYLWIKATIRDFVRLHDGIEIQIPGFLYLLTGFQWILILFSRDSVYGSFAWKTPSNLERFFLFEHPLFFWILVDILGLLVLYEFERRYSYAAVISKHKRFEFNLVHELMLSQFSFYVVTLLGMLLAVW